MLRFMELRRGTERVLRNWILPVLRESYEDTLAAAEGADLLVAHPITFATRLVAEKTGHPLGVDDGQPGRLLPASRLP